MSSSERLLQPLWNHILRNYGYVVSYWLFPAVVGYVTFTVVGIYFARRDVGPWRNEAARLHKGCVPTWKEVLRVGGIQIGVYAVLNTFMWFAFPYRIELPEEAPTVWELVRDICISFLVGDCAVYWEHRMFHMSSFLYKNVHYVHHRFKGDVFAFSGGWEHPIELASFTFCVMAYPVLLRPVHPLTLWIFVTIYVSLLLEEHAGQDVWWSPYHLIPDVLGGAVPHTVHHTRVQANYGFAFAIWDRIFGTYEAGPRKPIKG